MAVVVVLGAYRLDQVRNNTNRTLWQMLRDQFAGLRSRNAVDGGDGRRSRWLLALVPVVVVGVVVSAAIWLVVRDGTDGDLDPPAVAAGPGDTGEAGSGDVTQQDPLAGDGTGQEPLVPGEIGAATTGAGMAAAVSRATFPDGAENVVLTRQVPSVDALVAGGLQGELDAPLLLTSSDQLSPETAAEIERLGEPEIHVLGGTDAVAASIEEQLAAAGHSMHRHAGPTGVETAVDIALRHFPDADAAVLAPTFGTETTATETLTQAMVAGAYAAARDLPVLTSAADSLSPATAEYLLNSGIQTVSVVGSTDQLSDQVLADLESAGVAAQRIGGADAVETAVAVAEHETWPTDAGAATVVLAESTGDALWPGISIGAVYAAQYDAPLLLTAGDDLPAATLTALQQRPDGTQVLCMTGVTEAACAAAQEAVS